MIAWATGGWSSPGLMRYISGRNRSKPCGLILLKVLITKRVRGFISLNVRRAARIIFFFAGSLQLLFWGVEQRGGGGCWALQRRRASHGRACKCCFLQLWNLLL